MGASFDLTGKVVVVTGSTSGIGRGIAEQMAAAGAMVVVSGRREAEGQAVVDGIVAAGGQACFRRADVSQPADCRALIDSAATAGGRLDCLVNNAGIFPRCPFDEVDQEYYDRVMEVNLRAPFFCAQAATPHLRAAGGGTILNVGSCNGFGTGANMIVYGVTKGALWNLNQNLAKNLLTDRIRVNYITVGWVLTDMELEIRAAEGKSEADMIERGRELPTGRFSTPEEIGQGCVYLASDAAAHVTGCEFNISGGLRMRI